MVNAKLLKDLDEVLETKNRTIIMGVVNLSLDSFSKDGTRDLDKINKQCELFINNGAEIIDIGAQSSRPSSNAILESEIFGKKWGGEPNYIDSEKEIEILLPILNSISKNFDVLISVDTYRSDVAYESFMNGASIINDIWGLKYDPKIAQIVSECKGKLIIMHNQEGNIYNHMIDDIKNSLIISSEIAIKSGLDKKNIILDPGLGFGKDVNQNLWLLKNLNEFLELDYPLMIGSSRKSFIGAVLNSPINDRIEGTAATVSISIAKGADIVRVHDVVEISKTVKMTDAIIRGSG
jgi:dihydropteroate synthase|tara:strand:- start:6329 stop:7207 length:879 start_codon:yes stop_codon:yes gene_type:complete